LGWRFGFNSGLPYMLYGDGTNYTEGTIGSTLLNNNQWHFFIINYYHNTKMAVAFLDGSEVGAKAINISGSASNSYSLWIGQMGNGAIYTPGTFSNVRIYGQVLSSPEILAIYNSEKP
jgi:hypothetical protein